MERRKLTKTQVNKFVRESQYPTFSNVPKYESDVSAKEALALAKRCGYELLPYQSKVCVGSMGELADGTWSSPEVAIVLSRQNGKGVYGEVRCLAGIGIFEEKLIIWTSHQIPPALEAMQRILQAVNNCDDLRREVKKIVNVNGQECIEFYGLSKRSRITEPRRIKFSARTKHAGRGFTKADLIVFDETYHLQVDQQAAIMPTQSTMANSQILYLTSPPLDTATYGPLRTADATPGLILFKLRKRAKAGDRFLAYYEWSLDCDLDEVERRDPDTGEPVVDLDDRSIWFRMNPALGPVLQMKPIEVERESMSDRSFARERCGAWPPEPIDPKSVEARLVNPKAWAAMRVQPFTRGETVVFGIDSTPSRSGTSIVAYWVNPINGKDVVELVDYREGTAWLPGRMVELREKHNPMAFAFDAKSHIGAMLGELEAVGFKQPDPNFGPTWGDLYVSNLEQLVAATTGALDSIKAGAVEHGGQREFSMAVSGLALRDVGEGQQAFSRKSSNTDISPINGWAIAKQCWKERYGVVESYDPFCAIW